MSGQIVPGSRNGLNGNQGFQGLNSVLSESINNRNIDQSTGLNQLNVRKKNMFFVYSREIETRNYREI